MKPTARWWSKLLPTPAPNRKTPLPVHPALTEDLLTVCLPWICVYAFVQGQCSERMEAVVHPDSFPSLLWCHEAISAELSAGRLCQPHDAVPRYSILQQLNPTHCTVHVWCCGSNWLLLLIDRYRQGMWAESKEDFPVWRTHTVSQQHGTQSYAC